jgi:hypothetical protein
MGSKRSCDRTDYSAKRWRGSGGMRVALVALLAASLALSLAASRANAGPARYVYEMCDSVLPGGGTPGIRYSQSPGQPWGVANSCAQPGGSLSVSLNGSTPGGDADWGLPIEAPHGTRLESVAVQAAACGTAPGLWASVLDRPDWPVQNCIADDRSFLLTPETRGYIVALSCSGVYGSCGGGPWISARYFATTIVDLAPPSVPALGGSLLQGGILRGHQGLVADGSDSGGGLQSIAVTVNGLPAATRLFSCNVAEANNQSVVGIVAAQPSPCPPQAGTSWSLDTAAFPFRDGANVVAVCASDFSTLADPNTSCATRTVNVDDSCAESPVAGGEVLSAQFASSHNETVTVGYGKDAEVQGRLTDNAGDPVPGASLCVKMQTLGVDDRLASVGAVQTDANGEYHYAVAAGPNREVLIGYRHDTAQVARSVRYYAHARTTLHVDKPRLENGERLRFWGSLPGPNGGGRVVVSD